MEIRLNHVAKNMTELTIGHVRMYFSYQTCVAFAAHDETFRRESTYSKTTAGHMNKFGVKGWPIVSDAMFEAALSAALAR